MKKGIIISMRQKLSNYFILYKEQSKLKHRMLCFLKAYSLLSQIILRKNEKMQITGRLRQTTLRRINIKRQFQIY